MTFKKSTIALALLTGATLAAGAASAQQADYPGKPIRMIVPFAPGGTADIIGRVFAAQLGTELGATVVVENKAGAGGSIGTRFVADSPADGYILLLASSSTHGTNPAVYKNLTYDASQDFTAITQLVTVPGVLSVTKDFPAADLAALIAQTKANPDRFTYASSGAGGLGNLAMELMKSMTGAKLMHIAYRGAGPAFTDVISGQVSMIWEPVPASLPYIKGGQIRPIAIAADARSPELPDTPTFKEAGLSRYEANAWNGLLAPKGLPEDVKKKLHDASVKALNTPEVKAKMASLGGTVVAGTSDEFQQVITSDVKKWKNVAADAKIQLDQ
ncbi:Bug family tripartite tricarboxylate transporter substrate binding protein [Achromobacter deleyi]|uniref:Bug family tripartite tricarboxylate transporter substrate binding protein n=1 Tax=Achromobacter deleyi TaxID=1353891 RepID=UPI001491C1D4|nr:tripartite tricarboxylate transporter substrate binding protein [Achromobacter deleyi]QVQ27668.1 tripartite tricarboxylate transporter substrate binding protein [Achromobacter deleyi]UIP23267.1 tripartite tricarboxylate transporter substrate binding protein [Achromobacter deleyi]